VSRCLPQRVAWASALLAALALGPGCGVIALTHDKMLGPVSPAGNIHPVVVGDDFVVTERGVAPGESSRDQPMFRPVPPGFPRRYGEPNTFYKMLQGGQAFLRGLSFVVWGETRSGTPLLEDQLATLERGRSSEEVLAKLGTPNLWLRRKHGSLMAYKAELGTFLAFYVGMPPLADNIVPIPGLNNLSFRWHYNVIRPYKTLLLFDTDERLVAWFRNDPEEPEEAPASNGAGGEEGDG
jgi:hypothetical protein